jgi:hypothetical protein
MKNFSDRFIEQFKDLKVELPDVARNMEHLYADYVELVALFSNKSFVTASDILDRIKDSGGLRKKENQEEITVGEENDKNEGWITYIFQIIEERSNLFSSDYPFEFSTNKIIIKSNLTDKQELYLFLLISSNLDLFNKVKSELTSDFETISYYALKNYLPSHATVKQFGKKSDYSGNAIKKIKDLAIDLKVEVREHEIANISERNNQERGLDVIGWIPFSDNCPNLITILGQCACGKDWSSKHHDTKRYKHYLKFYRLSPYHAIFIPYALISKGGSKFLRSDDIEDNTLVFERKRIIDLLNNKTEFDALESKQIVDKCIKYTEDIV